MRESVIRCLLLLTVPALLLDLLLRLLVAGWPAAVLPAPLVTVWSGYLLLSRAALVIGAFFWLALALWYGGVDFRDGTRHRIRVNEDGEYVLSDYQKRRLRESGTFEIGLRFNSDRRGISEIREDGRIITFETSSSDDDTVRREITDWFRKHCGGTVTVAPGRNEKNRRWYRTITLA